MLFTFLPPVHQDLNGQKMFTSHLGFLFQVHTVIPHMATASLQQYLSKKPKLYNQKPGEKGAYVGKEEKSRILPIFQGSAYVHAAGRFPLVSRTVMHNNLIRVGVRVQERLCEWKSQKVISLKYLLVLSLTWLLSTEPLTLTGLTGWKQLQLICAYKCFSSPCTQLPRQKYDKTFGL